MNDILSSLKHIIDMNKRKEIFNFISKNNTKISDTWHQLVVRKLPATNMFHKIILQRLLLYFDIHLHYIAGAIILNDPCFYKNYVLWTKRIIESRNQQVNFVKMNFECIREAIKIILPMEYFEEISPLLIAGENLLDKETLSIASFYYKKPYNTEIAQEYINFIINGKKNEANTIIENQLNNGIEIPTIYEEFIAPCQYEIGRLWELNIISVAQEHLATAISQYIMANLFPRILSKNISNISKPHIIGACIGPELHELGLRMIMDMFEFNGWDTIFLGANNPIDDLLLMLKNNKFDVLAISVTMVSHLNDVIHLIAQIKQLGLKRLKIIVGGYPFNQNKNLWKIVDADGYAGNFYEALSMALFWINEVN